MANPNVFLHFAEPVRSVDYFREQSAAADYRRQQNALEALVLREKEAGLQSQVDDRNAIQRLASRYTNDAQGFERALLTSGRSGLMTQGQEMTKARLDAERRQGEIAGANVETQRKAFTLAEDKRKAAIQQVAALNSADEAIALIQQQAAEGTVNPRVAQALTRLVQTDPKWQLKVVMGISDPKEMLALLTPHLQTNNVGGQTVTQAVDKTTGVPTVTGRVQNTASPDAVIAATTARRGQDIGRDAALQGGSVQIDAQGNMVVVPNKVQPGQPVAATPVVDAAGKPVQSASKGAAAAVPAEVKRQIGGVLDVDKGLSALEAALKDFNPRSSDQLSAQKRARIQSIAKQVQLSAKEAAALGALSGPDMELIEGILADPTSMRGAVAGSGGLSAQIAEARAGNKRRITSLRQQYGDKVAEGLPPELLDKPAGGFKYLGTE